MTNVWIHPCAVSHYKAICIRRHMHPFWQGHTRPIWVRRAGNASLLEPANTFCLILMRSKTAKSMCTDKGGDWRWMHSFVNERCFGLWPNCVALCLPSSLFNQLSCPDSHAKTQTVASSAGKWPLFHTHICTHRDAANKSILHVLLPACQLAAHLCVQSHTKSLMRLGTNERNG